MVLDWVGPNIGIFPILYFKGRTLISVLKNKSKFFYCVLGSIHKMWNLEPGSTSKFSK
jgi:hypothetical protein